MNFSKRPRPFVTAHSSSVRHPNQTVQVGSGDKENIPPNSKSTEINKGPTSDELWKTTLNFLKSIVHAEDQHLKRLKEDHSAMIRAIDMAVDTHDAATMQFEETKQQQLKALEDQRKRVLASVDQCRLDQIQVDKDVVTSEKQCLDYVRELSEQEEATVVAQNEFEGLLGILHTSTRNTENVNQTLRALKVKAELMSDNTFGLSSEAAALVTEDERLKNAMEVLRLQAIETEVERRHKFSLYEELKGTIRVYCRVKGGISNSDEDDNGNANLKAKFSFTDTMEDMPVSTRTLPTNSIDGQVEEMSPLTSPARVKRVNEKRCLTLTLTRGNATSTGTKETKHDFQYDRVYSPSASQKTLFEDVGPLVDCAVDGYRVCIMAYGQTGSGKTYTMIGPSGNPIKDGDQAGLIPRSIEKVFSRIASLEEDGWKYNVTCYFVEIYNEMIRDLLSSASLDANQAGNSKHHRIEHIGRLDTKISNVKMEEVTKPSEVYSIIARASNARAVATTKLNERSSRSHCVFTLRIQGRNDRIKQSSLGNLCLVDLAGSERINDSGAVGQQRQEAININKSLSFLGDCICSMGTGSHVVWTNCKLTQLLQNYLGGEGSKVLMIAMVSDMEEHATESLNTLNFGKKVNQTRIGKATRRIVNAP